MKPLKVLSLFDGIAVGRVALERAGFQVESYDAFEIEPNAIKIALKNYPDIIEHGDVFDTDFTEFKDIDLLCGGSPCTGWSKAKNHTAKYTREITPEGIGWDLFQRYVKALHTVKPKYFLYENNYGIAQEVQDAISEELGVQPIMIDAALVSAQRRKRLYWTNIPGITQPEDKGLLFKDVIVDDPSLIRTDPRIGPTIKYSKNYVKYDLGGHGYYSQQDRAYFPDSKAPTVPRCRTDTKFNLWLGNNTYKKTCPVEIERLMTLPDGYTDCVAMTRRYEALGNSWVVDVIAHIFSFIKE